MLEGPLGRKAHVVYGERDATVDFQHEHATYAGTQAAAPMRRASVT
jgi:hypothetical protein